MIILEIDPNWTIASTLFTIGAFVVTAIYTAITFSIFRQNKNANQLSAYLALKKDLTSNIFIYCTNHCSKNKIKIDIENAITESDGYKIETEILTVNQIIFIRDILGNLEDLALFHEKNILSFELIDAGYGYSILHIGNNDEVRKLIKTLKEKGSVYNGFANLYVKLYQSLNYIENKSYKQNLFEN